MGSNNGHLGVSDGRLQKQIMKIEKTRAIGTKHSYTLLILRKNNVI